MSFIEQVADIVAPQAQFQMVPTLGRREILLSPHDVCAFAYVVRAKDSWNPRGRIG